MFEMSLSFLRTIAFGVAVLMVLSAGCFCSGPSKNNAIDNNEHDYSFSFDYLGRMHASVIIDGIEYDALFDTGCEGIILDSIIFSSIIIRDSTSLSTIFSPFTDISSNAIISSQDLDVGFCDKNLHFNKLLFADIKKSLGVDLVFSLPISSNLVVHIDFVNSQLSLNDSIPTEVISTHQIQSGIKKYGSDIEISLPFSFTNERGEHLSCILDGTIDTGSGSYMTAYGGRYVVGDEKMLSFLSKSRIVLTDSNEEMFLLNQQEPFDDIASIIVRRNSHIATLIFGNAILSHYDIWMDLKDNKLYAHVIDDYIPPQQRYLEATGKNMIARPTKEGLFVEYCSRYSPLSKSGFRRGDLIIGMDGEYSRTITGTALLEFDEKKRLHEAYILRNNDTLTLCVTPD